MPQEFIHHACIGANYLTDTVRVENDLKFLRILSVILKDDTGAVLELFPGSYIAVDDMNPYFGTTLLGFVVQCGTLAMLKVLLRSTNCVRRKHLYIYIRLAQARHENSDILIDTLLNKVSGFDTTKKAFTTELLGKAISTSNHILFDTVIRWFLDAPGFPGQLRMLEGCFDALKCMGSTGTGKTQQFLTYPAPPNDARSLNSARLVPAYMLGYAYQVRLHKVFYTTKLVHSHYSPEWESVERRQRVERLHRSPTPLFRAVTKGLMHWVDWFLWAGADPRHLEGDVGILDFAWKEGGNSKRKKVAKLLDGWGWEVNKLQVVQL
jgi:hypothetical protein